MSCDKTEMKFQEILKKIDDQIQYNDEQANKYQNDAMLNTQFQNYRDGLIKAKYIIKEITTNQ